MVHDLASATNVVAHATPTLSPGNCSTAEGSCRRYCGSLAIVAGFELDRPQRGQNAVPPRDSEAGRLSTLVIRQLADIGSQLDRVARSAAPPHVEGNAMSSLQGDGHRRIGFDA
jgi:hypothetical protein